MEGNIILTFLYDVFVKIWNIFFRTYTPFAGLSIGMILLGVVVIGVLWSIVISMLQIGPSDFSNLGSPKDYYHKYKKEKARVKQAKINARIDAEVNFRANHHGKLVGKEN